MANPDLFKMVIVAGDWDDTIPLDPNARKGAGACKIICLRQKSDLEEKCAIIRFDDTHVSDEKESSDDAPLPSENNFFVNWILALEKIKLFNILGCPGRRGVRVIPSFGGKTHDPGHRSIGSEHRLQFSYKKKDFTHDGGDSLPVQGEEII